MIPRRLSAPLLGLLLLALAAAGCDRPVEVSDHDRPMMLRVADLAPYGYEYPDAARFETFRKSRSFDGSYTVEYEFQTPDGEREKPLYLYVMVTVDPSAGDASLAQGASRTAAMYTLDANGIKERELKGFPRYGSGSSFHLLEKDGEPVGNYFTVRSGGKVYTLMMSGLYFDDPATWREIIEPRLKAFAAYSPG